jgi:hypothetical protein
MAYNPGTRRITTYVHVKFQENTPGLAPFPLVDSSIGVFFDADAVPVTPAITSSDVWGHVDSSDAVGPMYDVDRPPRLRGPPAPFEDYVAHMSIVPCMCVTNNCSPELSKEVEDLVALPDFSMMVGHRRHKFTAAPTTAIALVYANVCVEPNSYKDARVSPQAADWEKAMQFEFASLTTSETWEMVPVPDELPIVCKTL